MVHLLVLQVLVVPVLQPVEAAVVVAAEPLLGDGDAVAEVAALVLQLVVVEAYVREHVLVYELLALLASHQVHFDAKQCDPDAV